MSLIKSETPVQRFSWSRQITTSGIAVVGKTADNRYELVSQFGKLTPYRLAFEVDVSDHHDVIDCALPGRGDVFFFQASIIIDWRVTDPVAVVVRRTRDGLTLCTDHLVDRMRDITRQYPIEESAAAEQEIRRVLANSPITLPEGITMHAVRPQLTIDDTARTAAQAAVAANRNSVLAVIKGRAEIGQAHHEQALRSIEQDGELVRRQRSRDAIQEALQGNYDPIAIHLGQHPDQTGDLLNMIRADFQAGEQRRDNLIMELLRRDLIQDIDVADLNSSLLGGAANAYRTGPQRTIGGPRIVQSSSIPPPAGSLAASSANSSGYENEEPEPDEQPVVASDGSGITGWRRLPPRPAG
ncbi:MAG: hypothetical protein ACJ72N_01195 [Labedaea sp.]